jgi:crotonobetainyl-CoA:carnitine CoA-transferase CaiB-like acyl-CoA transferase
MRPFEGIKILDCTHVLAGPFAAYQLAVLGADVIKVDDPNEPDQSRESGADHALNRALMGTGFLTQGSNKRAIALNLKTEGGARRSGDWSPSGPTCWWRTTGPVPSRRSGWATRTSRG